jgi:hypothetical protein
MSPKFRTAKVFSKNIVDSHRLANVDKFMGDSTARGSTGLPSTVTSGLQSNRNNQGVPKFYQGTRVETEPLEHKLVARKLT